MKNTVLKKLEKNELDANKLALLYSTICLVFFLLSYFNATWWLMLTGQRDVVISAGLLPTFLLGGLILLEIWLRSSKMNWLVIIKEIIISDWQIMRTAWRKKVMHIFFWFLYATVTSLIIWWAYEDIPRHYNRDMGWNSNSGFYVIALIMQTILINVMPTIIVGYNITRMSKTVDYIQKNQLLIKDILIFSVSVIQFGFMHSYISAPVAWGAAFVLGLPKWWMYRQNSCMIQISLYHAIIASIGFYLQVL